MKYLLPVLGLLLTLGAPAQTRSLRHSPGLTEAPPESVGMSAERLARIDVLCRTAIEQGQVPGIAALVARHGKIVYHRAFGMADNAAGRELKRDDIFRIASQTKAITATAVMMLWEEGRFRLDDPVSRFIPEFKNPQVLKSFNEADGTYTTVPAKSEITIRQLLNHTSGIGYGVLDEDPRIRAIYKKAGIVDTFSAEAVVLGDNIRKLAKLPLHHHPGERFTYSEGLDVLGYVIEIISGQSFDVFLRERLFQPLGMNDTAFYLPAEKAARLVPVQKPQDGKWVRYPVTFYDPDYPIQGAKMFFSGGAGLCSTPRDYATFLQMYLNGGELHGTRFLSRTTIEAIQANQTGELWGGKNSDRYFGLVFGVVTPAGQAAGGKGSIGTFDWGGYFNTHYFADSREQIMGVIMKQTQDTSEDTDSLFRQLVFQAIDD